MVFMTGRCITTKEGLSAPMGTFSNYKREPRAVLVLDRSLRERAEPGVRDGGPSAPSRPVRAPLFLDQPRVAHAFPFEVQADPVLERERKRGKVDVQPIIAVNRVEAGRTFRPLFQLTDRETGCIQVGCQEPGDLDVQGRRGLARRHLAASRRGIYGADFVPGEPGTDELFVSCESAGLSTDRRRGLFTIHVVEAAGSQAASGLRAEANRPHPGVRGDGGTERERSPMSVRILTWVLALAGTRRVSGRRPLAPVPPFSPEPSEAAVGPVLHRHDGGPRSDRRDRAGPSNAASRATGPSKPARSIPMPTWSIIGRPVRFYSDLVRGRLVAINFIFTTCTGVCPPMGATSASSRATWANGGSG